MPDFYFFENGSVVSCSGSQKWRLQSIQERRVAETIVGEARVSTVFLGIDHGLGDGPPVLFETMIFGGDCDSLQERYSTLEEAKSGHQATVDRLKRGVSLNVR